MSGKLLQEIHKVKPFESVQQEAFLNVIRTADHLMRGFEELLKPHNLSPTQYNVLRILRGTGGCCDGAEGNGKSPGVPCKKIGEHKMSNYINGWEVPVVFDVTESLIMGRNVLAVKVTKDYKAAGLYRGVTLMAGVLPKP